MKGQSIFLVKSTHKTKTWWMFLSVLVLVFVPFLIVWLLSGEFNLLNNDWLIAKGTSVWHGHVTDGNIEELAHRYAKFCEGGESVLFVKLQEYLGSGKQGSIDAYKTFFEPIILAPLLGLLVWSFIYPIIFNATKISGLDVLPFSFGIGTFMIVLIISGLMNQWGQELMAVYWLARIAIAAVCTFIVFLLTNLCVNKFLSTRSYAMDIYFGYKKLDEQNAMVKQQLKQNIDEFKKQRDSEESYVEIKEGE